MGTADISTVTSGNKPSYVVFIASFGCMPPGREDGEIDLYSMQTSPLFGLAAVSRILKPFGSTRARSKAGLKHAYFLEVLLCRLLQISIF